MNGMLYPTTQSVLRKLGCKIISENFINCRGLNLEIVSMPRSGMQGVIYRAFYPIQTIEISQGLPPEIEAEAMFRAVNSQYKAHHIPVEGKSALIEGFKQAMTGVTPDYSGPSLQRRLRSLGTLLPKAIPEMSGLGSSISKKIPGYLSDVPMFRKTMTHFKQESGPVAEPERPGPEYSYSYV